MTATNPTSATHAGILRTATRVALADDELVFTDRSGALTGPELLAAAAACGTTLERDAHSPAPRVGIRAANSLDYLVAYVATLDIGGVPFLVDYASGPVETAAIVADCSLDLLVHDATLDPPEGVTAVGRCGELTVSRCTSSTPVRALHESTEVCRFTSGSSGRAKCIEFSGHAVYRAASNWRDGTALGREDDILCYASLSNGLAFNTSLLAAMISGARLHLASGLPTAGAVVRRLAETRATRLVGFPALYESLVRRELDASTVGTLRMAISSAAPLAEDVRRRFVAATGVPVQNYYGVAEAGPITFARDPLTDPGLGEALPGAVVRAGAPGEPGPVEVHSESMGTRYLNVPGAFEARLTDDGFYGTGDTGYLSPGEHGDSLVLTGRPSEVVNIGGRKLDAVEIATVLRSLEGIDDAIVLGVDDGFGGTALAAVIASSDPDIATVARREIAARLAPYKVPSLIRTVERIPTGSSGKAPRAELRRLFDTAPSR